MAFFDHFPTVQKCCIWVKLRVGCFLIGIIILLMSGLEVGHYSYHTTQSFMDRKNSPEAVLIVLWIVCLINSFCMFIGSILLLLGLSMGHQQYVRVFLWAFFVNILVIFIVAIVYLTLAATVGSSEIIYTCISTFIQLIVYFYWLCVVNTYANEM